jgi:sugar transferase (PEP-CTERM/EpsH1 system associated)
MHLVYRFDTGGLENGIVNLINHMPPAAYRHLVVALTEVTEFKHRVRRHDVRFFALNKPAGQGVWQYPKFLSLLRRERPAVVHTRNLGTLEFQLPAALARVPVRIHGEHGRDIDDLDGSSRRHRWLRHAYSPFVQHYVALSEDLADYLVHRIGMPAAKVSQIYNGVDSRRFVPRAGEERPTVAGFPFSDAGLFVIGTVGRMQAVKAQTLLAQAFVLMLKRQPALRHRLRLVMVGDGPLRAEVQSLLRAGNAAELAWLPGERADVAELMQLMDAFVLPSLAEGVSNTILEAMASGLPVIATAVGANAELVQHGVTGVIVPSGDAGAMAEAIVHQVKNPESSRAMGRAARDAAVQRFSIAAMAANYQGLYDRLLTR